jgi:Mn-dependent DtxR family transcriptional regulator
MDEVEIRRKILYIIYDLNKITQEYSIDSRDLKEKMDVSTEELLSNVKYLEGDGYLELEEFLGNEFKAKITLQGIKKVEKMRDFS